MKFERNEYPRPQFRRDEWIGLNGEWEFEFDDNRNGEARGLHTGEVKLNTTITVPFSYQYEASGIGDKSVHDTVWYRRSFEIKDTSKSALLCFNGSDYITDVWINGYHALCHVGGFTPFKSDITPFVKEGANVIVVKCFDSLDLSVPRGKQSWTGEQFSCWYYPNTGIWQSVWIEFFIEDCIDTYSIISDIDEGKVLGEIETLYGVADEMEITVTRKELPVSKIRVSVRGKNVRYSIDIHDRNTRRKIALWTPESPDLYYMDIVLYKNGDVLDRAHTRFGMRKISVNEHGQICLNNCPYYQKLILDQGYWKESGLTPPSVEALEKDIRLCKQMGFNGARKHQKIEDPYWYYLADELGFLTWCEMPSAYDFCDREILAYVKEWSDVVAYAKNFTSTVAYVPLNESWGVQQILTDKRQQDLARAMYYIAKTVDGTRLVSTNDGWENVMPTDMVTVHDYAYDDSDFQRQYVDTDVNVLNAVGKKIISEGNEYSGQPIIFSEFGGIAMKSNSGDGNWGYGESADDAEAFYVRLGNLMGGIRSCPFQGYCYTQVSDVQQEVNGLLDENHNTKFDIDRLAEIFS